MLLYVAKKDFADVIKVRILRWGDYLALAGWADVTTMVLIRGRQEIRVSSR